MEEKNDLKNAIATQKEEEIRPWNYEVLDEALDPDPVNSNENPAFETSYGTNHIEKEQKLNHDPIVDIKKERKLFDDFSVEAKGNICKICPHLQQIYFSENDLKVHNKLIHSNSAIKNEDKIYGTLEEKPRPNHKKPLVHASDDEIIINTKSQSQTPIKKQNSVIIKFSEKKELNQQISSIQKIKTTVFEKGIKQSEIIKDEQHCKHEQTHLSKEDISAIPSRNTRSKPQNTETTHFSGKSTFSYIENVNVICVICKMNFTSVTSLRLHKEIVHEGKKPHKCDLCDSTFGLKHQLQKHITSMHEGMKPYDCDLCDNSYSSNRNLRNHQKSIHEGIEKPKPHSCNICNSTFSRPVDLKSHILVIHEGKKREKPHKCDMCDTRFSHENELKKHIITVHEGTKPYACDLCGRGYASNKSLNNHKKSFHEGIELPKPHSCNICNASFSRPTLLKEHILSIHEKKKDIQCEVCGASFSTARNLKGHTKSVHERKHSYECGICHKIFFVKSYLKQHVLFVHEKSRPHKCNICEKSYFDKRCLRCLRKCQFLLILSAKHA